MGPQSRLGRYTSSAVKSSTVLTDDVSHYYLKKIILIIVSSTYQRAGSRGVDIVDQSTVESDTRHRFWPAHLKCIVNCKSDNSIMFWYHFNSTY